MPISTWLLYVTTIMVLIVTPGPVAMVCLNHGAKYPFNYSIFSAIGGVTAACVMILLSMIGIGAIISSNSNLFNLLKIAGGTYLLYLGLNYLGQIRKQGNGGSIIKQENNAHKKRKKIFMSAFLAGVSNPKNIIFFIALFPQFIQPHASKMMQLLILVLTWIIIDLLVMTAYVVGQIILSNGWSSSGKYTD